MDNIQVNEREYIFEGLFLNKEGMAADKQGVDTNGKDEYYQIKPVVIVLAEIESFFESDDMQNGKVCCNVQMRSGAVWTLLITITKLMGLIKTRSWFNN